MAGVIATVRPWLPDAAVGLAVLLAGVYEVVRLPFDGSPGTGTLLLVCLGVAVAAGLSRGAPGAALALVWVLAGLQVLSATPVLTVELAVMIVAFGCARWGHPVTVVLAGLSIPAAAAVGAYLVVRGAYGFFTTVSLFRELLDTAYRFSDTLVVGAVVLGTLALSLPWLAGLVLRATARAQRSEVSQVAAEEGAARAQREALQAQEIARLRDEQTRLARDVHDVVGHSLAVILAQAESAQYLPDADTEKLKATMATIATSARTSLQDVRQVLTSTQQPAVREHGLDALVAGVRASGHEVISSEVGAPQPLPPELDVVAYRVLQEMLTNAIKHGRRDTPVHVERHWEGELRIEVRNVVAPGDLTQPIRPLDPASALPPAGDDRGQGVEGMRRRLEAVGGRLDVRRRDEAGGATFTATAWVPVRGAR